MSAVQPLRAGPAASPRRLVIGLVMWGRAFSWRVTAAMAGAVVAAGLLAAALLWVML